MNNNSKEGAASQVCQGCPTLKRAHLLAESFSSFLLFSYLYCTYTPLAGSGTYNLGRPTADRSRGQPTAVAALHIAAQHCTTLHGIPGTIFDGNPFFIILIRLAGRLKKREVQLASLACRCS